MGVIEEVHEDLDADVTLAAFRDAVEEKVAEMGELADQETAAMLVAYELSDDRITSIGDIAPEQEEVKFTGKVRRVGELRTFEREDEDEPGYVINVELLDETGGVRVAFWDEQARAVERDGVSRGDVLRIRGRPRDGPRGLEVSAQQGEIDENAEIDVDLDAGEAIADLTAGQEGITVVGRVLEVDDIRTFERDDGSEGRVSNVVIGDETGSLRVTLWDDQAEDVEAFEEGDVLEVDGGSVRDRDGTIECHVGAAGRLRAVDADVRFVPEVAAIGRVEPGETVDIAGVVRSADELRTFERDDGSTGRVRNVRIQDETGDIRVAIWGDRAERELAPGDTVWFGTVEIQEGWQDALEASVNWQSSLAAIERDSLTEAGDGSGSEDRTEPETAGGLDSFTDDRSVDGAEPTETEPVTFTGTVVQTGNPVILDDGEEAVRVETRETVTLGEELTVVGERRGERIDPESIRRPDGKR